MDEPKITDWIAVIIAVLAAGVSIVAVCYSKVQMKIAKRALVFSRSSARSAEDSAKTAKDAVKEGFRPLLQLHTTGLTRVPNFKESNINLNGRYCYRLYVTNTGNRQCKDIEVTVSPSILIIKHNKHTSITVEESIDSFSENFLNVGKQKCLNNKSFLVAEDVNSKLTFTITYKELDDVPSDKIAFSASLSDLMDNTEEYSLWMM
jgi:hypothetical protein